MLTRQDLGFLFGLYRICSKVNFYSIRFDGGTGEFSKETSWIKRKLWRIIVSLTIVYGIFVQIRFLQCIMHPTKKFFVKDFSYHIIISCLAATANICNVKTYKSCVRETILLQREFLERNSANEKNELLEENRYLGMCQEKYKRSFHEMLLIVSPISVVGAAFTFPLNYWVNEASAQFLYSVVPEEFKNVYVYVTLVIGESTCILIFMSVGVHGCAAIIGFLERTTATLTHYKRELQRNTNRDCAQYKRIQNDAVFYIYRLHLELIYFNAVYAPVNYAMKILCLVAPIGGFSIGIRYFVDDPFFAIFNMTVGLYGVIYYNVLYGKAFAIPAMIQELKAEILKRQTQRKNTALISKMLRAQPGFGVKMGGFHSVERASSLLYLDFIVQKICSVLLSSS